MEALETFEKMLTQGKDGALLRYGLGNEYLKAKRAVDAVEQLRVAVRLDPAHCASWKLLGRALTEAGAEAEALDAYRQGIAVARARGDIQAAKEMQVFARRIEKRLMAGEAGPAIS